MMGSESKSVILEACELLKGITCLKEERDDKNRVTKSFLRKIFEVAQKEETREGFLLHVGYTVAKREADPNSEILRFLQNLRNKVSKFDEKSWKEKTLELLEATIKLYYVKADENTRQLGDEICKTS